MDTVLFGDEAHERFYYQMLGRCYNPNDAYCQALLYLLGVCDETRRHVDDMFDFGEMGIKPESLLAPWQTGGTSRLSRLAFNLWNGWTEDGAGRLSAPYELFACGLAPYFLQAVRLRYPEYCNTP